MDKELGRMLSMWGVPGSPSPAMATGGAAVAPDLAGLGRHLAAAAAPGWREQALLAFRLGWLALLQGEVRSQALPAFDRMHSLAAAMHDQALQALARIALAVARDTVGQRQASLAAAQGAERLATAGGNVRLVALALNAQAQYGKEAGDYAQALALFRRLQAIAVAAGDAALQMASHIGFGRSLPMDEAPAARQHYQQAIAMARQQGDLLSLSLCYNNLADWHIYAAEYAESIALREQSLDLSRRCGDAEGIGRALLGMAKAETLLGHPTRARELLHQGLPLVLRAEDVEGELHACLNLAHFYAQDGDMPRACDYYQRTLDKSMAAPDAACARFAREALARLAAGGVPQPGILLQPAAAGTGPYLYPTGDRRWSGLALFWAGT